MKVDSDVQIVIFLEYCNIQRIIRQSDMQIRKKSLKYFLAFFFLNLIFYIILTESQLVNSLTSYWKSEDLLGDQIHVAQQTMWEYIVTQQPDIKKHKVIAQVSDQKRNQKFNDNNQGIVKQPSASRNIQLSVDSCENTGKSIKIELNLPSVDRWVTAFDKVHVYSAYLIEPKSVRITGVSSGAKTAYCQLWFGGGSEESVRVLANFRVVPASFRIIPETHGFKYVPAIIACTLPADVSLPLVAVSVVATPCATPDHLLPVHTRPVDGSWQPKFNFTVCPAPLNREYGHENAGEFLQYIEVNGLFGADHFVFYNHSVSNNLLPFIDYYTSKGLIEVLPWQIPIETAQGPTNEIHYFGQVIAQQDCFYRALITSRYVVGLDMDEVIMPMHSSSWIDVMNTRANVAYNSFANVFFRKEWKQDVTFVNNPIIAHYPIDSLLYTQREPKVWPHGSRSKYIARPECIEMAGIHSPFGVKAGVTAERTPATEALLAHYRNWEDYSESAKQSEKRMHDFSSQILERVANVVLRATGNVPT